MSAFQTGSKQNADAAMARAFYACGIIFSLIESKYFKEAIHAVAATGQRYKSPSSSAVAGRLLSDEVANVGRKLYEFKANLVCTGCTLVSDGWTNVQNRQIKNFLFVSAQGAMFEDAIDTSARSKDAEFIACELSKRIDAIGIDNVVQVVTDSAGNCVTARQMFASKYKSVVFSPCTAHCLDLLEDISKLNWVRDAINNGHQVVKFITNHQSSLAYFRDKSLLELLKPGETRFATYFIMLQRVQQTKDSLQETFMDRDFKMWLSRALPAIMSNGKIIMETVIDERFWDSVDIITTTCEPIVSLLRLVDGDIPSVGNICWKMFELDNNINTSTHLN